MEPYRKYNYNTSEPIYSIVTPVYNQENIIIKNIKSYLENTLDYFEIIIVLDFCFDDTEKNLLKFLDTYNNTLTKLTNITIFKNSEKPLFETKCDNIGFRAARGKYCLEIQADMEMTLYGYNIELTKPFLMFNNVIAVSGRCAHSLFLEEEQVVGKIISDDLELSIEQLEVEPNIFYVLDTCIRGPLLLDRAKLEELGFLNEIDYFLDNSDHDLMLRAYLEKEYICGYVPINFKSPISDGSTRNYKDYNCIEYDINRAEKQKLTAQCNSSLERYRDIWKRREPLFFRL